MGRFLEETLGIVGKDKMDGGKEGYVNIMLFSDEETMKWFLGGDYCAWLLIRLTLQGPLGVGELLDETSPWTRMLSEELDRRKVLGGLEQLVLRGQVSRVKDPESGVNLYRCETPVIPGMPTAPDGRAGFSRR